MDFWWRATRKQRKEKIRNLKIINVQHYWSNRKKTIEMAWVFEEDDQ